MMNSGVHSEEEDDGDIGGISSNSSVPSLHISNDLDLILMQFNYISQPLSDFFDADPPNLSDVLRNDLILTQAGAHGDKVCCDWDNDPILEFRVGSPTTTRVTPAGVTRITPGNSG